MDYVLLTLLFIVLLAGFVIAHQRLLKFESYLKDVGELTELKERLKSMSEALKGMRTEGVEGQVEQLQKDFQAMRQTLVNIERALSRSVPASNSPEESISAGARICGLVEARLLEIGYSDLHIITDLSKVSLEDEINVVVECKKGEMPYKGKVVTSNGAIREIDMRSSAPLFP